MHRRRARAAVLAALYQWDLVGQDLDAALAKSLAAAGLSGEAAEFARRLAFTVRDHRAAIDRLIAQLAIGWRVERMAVVDRNILRMGVAELVYSGDVPVNVAINEAVELAKVYSNPEAARFVNGILGELARRRVREPVTAGDAGTSEGVESHGRPDP